MAPTLLFPNTEGRGRGRGRGRVSEAVSPQLFLWLLLQEETIGHVWRCLLAAPPWSGCSSGWGWCLSPSFPHTPPQQSFWLSGISDARKGHLLLRETMEYNSQTSGFGSERKEWWGGEGGWSEALKIKECKTHLLSFTWKLFPKYF